MYVSDSTLLLPVSPVSERSIAASFPEEERRNVVSERGDQVEGTDLIIHPWRSGSVAYNRSPPLPEPRLIGSFLRAARGGD